VVLYLHLIESLACLRLLLAFWLLSNLRVLLAISLAPLLEEGFAGLEGVFVIDLEERILFPETVPLLRLFGFRFRLLEALLFAVF